MMKKLRVIGDKNGNKLDKLRFINTTKIVGEMKK